MCKILYTWETAQMIFEQKSRKIVAVNYLWMIEYDEFPLCVCVECECMNDVTFFPLVE